MRAATGWSRPLRTLLRSPAFTFGVVATLGLGIGVTAAAFSVVRGVLLKPLPHDDGDRLVYLRQAAPGAGLENIYFSVPEIDDYRQQVPSFASVAEFSSMRFAALDLDRPRLVGVGIVTGNYFEVMGLGTVVGRALTPQDDGEDTDAVAVLTHRAWRTMFGEDPEVVGRTFRMNGRTVTVVGVAEPHPPYPERTDMYVNMVTSPHHLGASMNHDRTHRMTEVFARLAPGATAEGAAREALAVAERMRADNPEAYDPGYGYSVSLNTLQDQLARRARTILVVLLSSAVLVFVVALANVANLILTRATRLTSELSIRASLGATSGDLRGRLLSENLLLGTAGAVLGAVVATAGTGVLAEYVARFSVRATEIRMDVQVLAATLALGVGTAALLAFLPRLPADRGLASMARAGRSGGGRGIHRVQAWMVSAQVALSLMLVFGAGLLARTLLNLQAVDAGFTIESVLAMDIPVVANGRSDEEILSDHLAMEEEVGRLPGVVSAALTNSVPLGGDGLFLPWTVDVAVEGQPQRQGEAPYRTGMRTVTAGYFETLQIEARTGRAIEPGDDHEAPFVVVVNEAFVREILAGREALGTRLRWGGDFVRFAGFPADWFTVVGVVPDMRERSASEPAEPTAFVSHLQAPFGRSMIVRAQGDPAALAAAVEDAIHRVEPEQPVENLAPLSVLRRDGLGDTRLNALLVGLLATLSLVIAAVGIFAALAFSVSQRTREMGVRMALGADGTRVVRFVMREGLAAVGVGIGLGLLGSVFGADLMGSLLYGVAPTDPWTLAGGSLCLGLVAVAATALPAVRAASVDPARVLGQDQ